MRIPTSVIAAATAAGLAFLLLAPSCGPEDPDDDGPPNGPGDENTVTAAIGPEGGTVSAGTCWVSFPAGSLETTTDVTVTLSEDPAPNGFQAFSPVCIFEPFDLDLKGPANVKLGFQGLGEAAALFHAAGDVGRFQRVGGAVDGSWMGAGVGKLGRVFVGHSADFEDPPEPDCARARVLGGRPHPALSSVVLNVAAEDCEGRPIPGLDASSFILKENASEVGAATKLHGAHQVFLTLVLDASSPMQALMNEVIEAVRALIDGLGDEELSVRLAVEMFGGGEETIVWRSHRLPDESLRADIADIIFDLPTQRHDPNLHGAILDALARLAEARRTMEAVNHGGTTTSGFVLLISSQKDGAGLHSLEDTLAAVAAAGSEDGVRVLGIGLHGADYDPVSLHALAPDGVTTSRGARLKVETGFAAWKIARMMEATYRLAFCSGQTAGTHTASAELRDATVSEAATISFDADGFGPACDAAILASACENSDCGGLGCGACDDTGFECDPVTATCKSFCERPTYCAGDTFTNPRGYEQTCPPSDTNTRCGSQCVDLASSQGHCGECWLSCNEGMYCADGSCVCPEDLLECDGICRDTTSDTSHCGDCNLPCAEGGECQDSECVCPGEDTRICNGVCKDLAVDPLNCGGCGVVCAAANATSCNHGVCGGPRWTSTPMPNPAGAGLPNPAAYTSQTETVTDDVTGIVWQRVADTGKRTWAEALAYCRGLDFGDGSNWRLPSRLELISLIDFTAGAPTIDQVAFPATPADWTWSSSPRAGSTTQAWAVDFDSGDSGTIMTDLRAGARCVRN